MKNLLISFSGGETSAFMSQWLVRHAHEFGYENLVFVFANTGFENEETLDFVEECDEAFGLNVYWIEAVVHHGQRKSSTHRLTSFENASRDAQPFEEVIKKYGIPNVAFPHCTRELKERPIISFASQYFDGEPYHTAIGIRADEVDRVNENRIQKGFIYPLISKQMIPATKRHINFFWSNQPFRLRLKGYQGNCITCWKKHQNKLYQIARENPVAFEFMDRMEKKYGRVGAEFLQDPKANDRVFFRGQRSAQQILSEADGWQGKVIDDSVDTSFQLSLLESESCEVFSECHSS